MSEEATQSLFEACSAQNGGSDDINALLQCIADSAEAAIGTSVGDIAAGVDTFYLIFAG
jgi:hypothetical protein